MHSLGHDFVPEAIHAGGLRYHGMSPLVSQAVVEGLLEPRSYTQIPCYEAAVTWARTEGVIPAPETSHAIAAVIDEAKKARKEQKEKTILFCFSGHGLLDLTGYEKYLTGKLADHALPESALEHARKVVGQYPVASFK